MITARFVSLALRRGHWVAGLIMASSMAHAGLLEDDEARRAILDLRQKVEQIQQDAGKKLNEQSKQTSDDLSQLRRALLDVQSQLESSRADIAKLRGENEQLARDVADMQRAQKDASQSLDDRLRKLEPARVSVDGREFSADAGEKRDFEAALAVFRKGDFAGAQSSFSDFLTRYSASGYRPSALFWLGNAQYATKGYKDALGNFRTLVQQTPDHMRVPEALLAMANCQVEMKDLKAARKTLEDLVAKYPGSEAASAGKDRLARLK